MKLPVKVISINADLPIYENDASQFFFNSCLPSFKPKYEVDAEYGNISPRSGFVVEIIQVMSGSHSTKGNIALRISFSDKQLYKKMEEEYGLPELYTYNSSTNFVFRCEYSNHNDELKATMMLQDLISVAQKKHDEGCLKQINKAIQLLDAMILNSDPEQIKKFVSSHNLWNSEYDKKAHKISDKIFLFVRSKPSLEIDDEALKDSVFGQQCNRIQYK